MAKMLPHVFPKYLLNKRGYEAEKEVYYLLKGGLGDSVTILHQVRFLWQTRRGIMEQEADFILIDEEKGVLILEVKGGILAVEEGSWYQYNRFGKYRKPLKRNPFEQADRTKHNFIDYLQENDYPWRDMAVGHGVILPHCVKPENIYGPDRPPEVCIDRNDLKNLKEAIDRNFRFWCDGGANKHPLNKVDTDRLIEALGFNQVFQGFETMGPMVGSDNKILQEMEQHEAFIIDQLQNLPRVSIRGCAGSGKTSMAISEAIRRAEAGQRVGLFCYNRLLGESLQMATGECNQPDNMVTGAFLDLCLAAHREHAPIEEPAPREDPEFWESLPAAARKYLHHKYPPFDAILIDEAQDFQEGWWPIVLSLLKDREKGVLQIFHDHNQCIFGARDIPHIPGMIPLVLHDNHRSPSGIGPVVQKYVAEPIRFRRHTTTGRLKQLHPDGENQSLRERLTETVTHLIEQEQVDPWDLVILTPNMVESSVLKDNLQLGAYRLVRDQASLQAPLPKDAIACYSVHRFKGLEAPVVIACEFVKNKQGLTRWQKDNYMRVCYTAFSRATTSLFILWDD